MSNLLLKISEDGVKIDAMEARLVGLRANARRSVPDWPDCIHVALSEEAVWDWKVILNMLASKLVHENNIALEMAIASPEAGMRAVWVRTR
jgi:hypothetical protein